ncbi:hypothetical protein [Phytoactinopolyspora endophytica]|uniref:hypothetical protein n=1 Tax=Phytoactinopolyspora endophytica TaxID=1642495 RepID=UPI00101C3DC7|nr:hypothetical protein [Phytoactinopolyspora endophytica]
MQLATRRVVGVKLAIAVTIAMTACSEAEQAAESAPLAQIASDEETAPAENGIDQLPGDEVLETAVTNLDEAGSFRVHGTTLADDMTIDIAFKVGEGSAGTVTNGSEVELVASEGVIYITSDADTLADVVDADIDDTIADKWFRVSSEESESGYSLFADSAEFADALLGLSVEGDPTSVKEVDGVPAVGLSFAESGGMLWVAAEGEPLPVRFEEKGASGKAGVLNFTDFGDDVDIDVPSDDDVIDPAELPSEDDEDGGESDDEDGQSE